MMESKGHILCVIYGNDLFGSERGTLRATQTLQEAGYKVTIAGSKRKPNGGAVGEAARDQGHDVQLIQFGSHLKKSWVLYNRHYRKSAWTQIKLSHRQFRTIVRDCQPSHIIICSTSVLPYLIGVLFFTRIPILYRMGDAPELTSNLHRPLWKWLVRKSTTIVAISDYMKAFLLRHGRRQVQPKNIHVIRNIAPHREGTMDLELTSNLTASKRPFQLVFVGQLTPQKGIHLVIEALIEMDNPNVGCWVIGEFMGNKEFDDNLRQMLRTTTSRTHINLLGYISDPRPYYKAANWHIAPSTYEEPLGNVVQEAQLQGTPSIVTNKGGLPELIDHEVTGWILSQATRDGIIEGIRSVLSDPAWASECYDAIRAKTEEYGPTEFSQAWLTAINAS